jgi:hypothetical protein
MATAETIDGVVGTYSGEITGGDDESGYDDGLRTDRNHLRVFSCREFGAQTSVQGRQYDGTGHERGAGALDGLRPLSVSTLV